MQKSLPSLTLVIPVYNGAGFLADTLAQAWGWLSAQERSGELLIVDDGSNDATPAILAAFAARCPAGGRTTFTALRNARNRGKGFSVRRAFLCARGDLVVFNDADLTYPLDNVNVLAQALEAGADVAYGSRMHSGSRYVVAPSFFGKLFSRHLMGRIFNLLVRLFVVRGVRDTQAGLKGCRREAAQLLARRLRLTRFSFDVELFFVARRQELRLADCPVLFIYRKEPSTVHFLRDSLAMLRDMARVRWRGFNGDYDRDVDAAALQDVRLGGVAPSVGPAKAATAADAARRSG
jgi:glycosyltransferase involved in cell wall biosynthesis